MDTPVKLYLDLSGYVLTGKSALTQVIREFEGFSVPDVEFEFGLFRMKDGLFDLEHSLVNDWSPLRSDAAIRRFIRLVKIVGNGYRRYSPTWLSSPSGYNYDKLINSDFVPLSLAYIDSLVESNDNCFWPFSLHDIHSIECFKKRVKYAFNKKTLNNEMKFVSYGENFIEKTKLYLEKLFDSPSGNAQVFHNAFEPYRAHDSNHYFDNGKSIVVDRDPRGVFANSKHSRYLNFNNIQEFISQFKKSREKSRHALSKSNVYTLKFEDLILNYDDTLEDIYRFLNVDRSIHNKKGVYFNPAGSVKNINSWKNMLSADEILIIENELINYCYES